MILKNFKKFFALIVLIGASIEIAFAQVSFVENSGELTINSTGYRVVLDADTGSFISIEDDNNINWLSRTLFSESPWVIRIGSSEFIAPGSLKARGGSINRTITPSGNDLNIEYVYQLNDAGTSFSAQLTLNFFDSNEFRGKFEINHQAGNPLELVSFPAYLEFPKLEIQRMVYPHRSGAVFYSNFFSDDNVQHTHNIPAGFTPFLWWETTHSTMAVSNLVDSTNRSSGVQKFNILRNSTIPTLHYDQVTELPAPANFESGWTLFQIGKNLVDSAHKHWSDGETNSFPKLSAKLSPAMFEKLSRSVLFKYPETVSAVNFINNQLSDLPDYSLVHVPGYMPGGHDENYPDYLPPDPSIGSLAEFQQLADAVRNNNGIFMPYTNPTWWDDVSLTVLNLGTGIVARAGDNSLVQETYFGRTGYVVSPWNSAVIARLNQGYQEFQTYNLADLLFEDQVGARGFLYDQNPAVPNWWSFNQGLLNNTNLGVSYFPLMCEGAWDQLAQTQSGFCNNLRLSWEQPNNGNPLMTDDMFDAYPLALIMSNEYSAFYPHNLAGEYMVHNRKELLYNSALGYQLAYNFNQGVTIWLDIAALVQKHLLSHRFGEMVTKFEDNRSTSDSLMMEFENGVIVESNWSDSSSSSTGEVVLSPEGFWLQKPTSPIVQGGWVSEYRNNNLNDPDGILLILEEMTPNGLRVISRTTNTFTIDVSSDWFGANAGSVNMTRFGQDDSTSISIINLSGPELEITFQPEDDFIELVLEEIPTSTTRIEEY